MGFAETPEEREARSSAEERAIEVFAEYLASREVPTDASFEQLLREHADLRRELLLMRAGEERFAQHVAALRATADSAVRRRPTWKRAAGIGASLLTAAALVVWIALATRPTRRADPLDELGRLVAERGTRLVEAAVVELRDSEAKTKSGPPIPGLATGTLPKPSADSLQTVKACRVLDAIVAERPAVADPALKERIAHARSTVAELAPDAARRDASAPVAAGETFLLALQLDPEIRARLNLTPASSDGHDALGRLVAILQSKAILRLRAIDLDADGVEVVDAKVYAQQAILPSNELDEPILLGATPLPPTSLSVGDWRITVVDKSSGETRWSELRILANPGQDLGSRVAFLRSTKDVRSKMVHFQACRFPFGTPPEERDSTNLAIPQSDCDLGEIWMDPYEATCEEFGDFYRDVRSHPAWFEGSNPIQRPSYLVGPNDDCPDDLRREAVVSVTWDEAVLYANWAGKRLPTDREWERVARGPENRRFPWGDVFSPDRIDATRSIVAQILASPSGIHFVPPRFHSRPEARVDAYESGATPPSDDGRRVYRMADNASEWVEDPFVPWDGRAEPLIPLYAALPRVMRGGDFMIVNKSMAQTWNRRLTVNDGHRAGEEGCRCAKGVAPTFAGK